MSKLNEVTRIIIASLAGIFLGFVVGVSLPSLRFPSRVISCIEDENPGLKTQAKLNCIVARNNRTLWNGTTIYAPTNPRGAELLPPGIVVPESDFYLRRLWGNPSEDLATKPKYLATFTVGIAQKENIDAAVKKFSENFTIVLFHYDGNTSEWNEFEWSKKAIHISARKQTKWWFAKRFLHPDIVAEYEYIFIWDEDLGVQHFDGEEYVRLMKKHGLEITQPALDPVESRRSIWRITDRKAGEEVHREVDEIRGRCPDPHLPPCASFVEIMAPVFSRDSWRCMWYAIQNDLVHGWGLDFALRRCVEPAYEKMGVVDAQYIVHQGLSSLGDQGTSVDGRAPWEGVRSRCLHELAIYRGRMRDAVIKFFNEEGITPPKSALVV